MHDQSKFTVHVVLASDRPDDHDSLELLLSGSPWRLLAVGSRREAAYLLHQVKVPIVLCDWNLDDEPWQQTVSGLIAARRRACVVVLANTDGSDLLSEVVRRGGFDLLTRPFEKEQVFATLLGAYTQNRVNWPQIGRTRRVPQVAVNNRDFDRQG